MSKTLHLTNPLTKGDDVKAAQELLKKHDYYHGPIDGIFGAASGNACKKAKFKLGYKKKDIKATYGYPLNGVLSGKIKLPLTYRLRAKARERAAKKHTGRESVLRAAIVNNWKWMIAHSASIHYEQRRPIDGEHNPDKLPLYTDCSGSVTDGYAWAHAPDPNGENYNGQGYTGTILNHCKHITRSELKPGDPIVFGSYPGEHVVGYLGDNKVMSHGHEGQPDDPREYTLDNMIAAFAGHSVNYLTPRSWS